MITNALALVNGKGGAGKTSCAANIAGVAANSGWRTLIVDLDPQGNLGRNLGYYDTDDYDEGKNLFMAVVDNDRQAEPIKAVRPNLDVLTGGSHTVDLEALIRTRVDRAPEALRLVEAALAPIVANYDLIVFDTPPASTSKLVEAALAASHYVVIPTPGDAGSLDGLRRTAEMCINVRSTYNPLLEVLGVVLFNFGVNDKALLKKAREQLEADLPTDVPVFQSFIRHSRKSSDDMREDGMLAYEYESRAQSAPKYWETVRSAVTKQKPVVPTFSQSASGVAEDYQNLTSEIIAALEQRLAA